MMILTELGDELVGFIDVIYIMFNLCLCDYIKTLRPMG